MQTQDYLGVYSMMGFVFTVQEIDGTLCAAVPGVPAGYEIGLEPFGDAGQQDTFRMVGGPLDQSTGRFVRGAAGQVTALAAGPFELMRVPPERAANLPVVERLLAPALDLTTEKEAAFQALMQAILAGPAGGVLDYSLPYPKHEFIQYLMLQDSFIFHGTNNRAIEVFMPRRTSVELYDRKGSGNLAAVYGTHDGLWSMFFAIVDRGRLRGSIRNGVTYFHNRDGEPLAVYNFSINAEQLAEQPWTPGALYMLERDAFKRQKFNEQAYSNEWACTTEVRPLARLDLEPEDFPFLAQIGGHDDGVLLRAGKLGETVRTAAVAARLDGARFTISVPNTVEMAQTMQEWLAIQEQLVPAAQFRLEEDGRSLTLHIDNLPPAYQQVFSNTYKNLL